MKANELRIGNWVNPDKPYQIDANSFQNVLNGEIDESPVPITNEWLKKFGFREAHVAGCDPEFILQTESHEWNWDKETGLVLFIQGEHGSIHFGKIPVHKLQNLFHEIEGEELKIKT